MSVPLWIVYLCMHVSHSVVLLSRTSQCFLIYPSSHSSLIFYFFLLTTPLSSFSVFMSFERNKKNKKLILPFSLCQLHLNSHIISIHFTIALKGLANGQRMLSFIWVYPFIVWVAPMRIRPLNGAMSVLGCTSRAAEGCSIVTTPLFFQQCRHLKGEKHQRQKQPRKGSRKIVLSGCCDMLVLEHHCQ